MEIIYQGTQYADKVRYRGGKPFDEPPYVVLYNPSTKKFFGVETTATEGATANTSYDFEFEPALTALMPTGVYHLEIYANSGKEVMLQRNDCFAEIRKAASSPDSVPQPSQQNS